MLVWALFVVHGANGLHLAADPQCDRVLLSTLRAELQVSGYAVHDDLGDDDTAGLQLTCDANVVKVRLEVRATQTTIERPFTVELATRALLVVKLSEFIHASLREGEPAPAAPAPVVSAEAAPIVEPPEVSAAVDDAPLELPGTWHLGIGVIAQGTPGLGVAPGLTLQIVRRVDQWEGGVWAQGGLSFATLHSTGGTVSINFGLAALTLARRFELASRFRLRALAGPGLLVIFANGTSSSALYSGRFVAKPAFAATVGAMAEYDVSALAQLFLGVNVSWSIPRAILALPEGDRTIAEPLVTGSAGVIF